MASMLKPTPAGPLLALVGSLALGLAVAQTQDGQSGGQPPPAAARWTTARGARGLQIARERRELQFHESARVHDRNLLGAGG